MKLLSLQDKIQKKEIEIKILQKNLKEIEEKISEHEKALILVTDSIKKMSQLTAEISIVQQGHLSQTEIINQQLETVISKLFPKDELKYDLMNEPYN